MSERYLLVNVTCIANNTIGTVRKTFRVVLMKGKLYLTFLRFTAVKILILYLGNGGSKRKEMIREMNREEKTDGKKEKKEGRD